MSARFAKADLVEVQGHLSASSIVLHERPFGQAALYLDASFTCLSQSGELKRKHAKH